MVYKASAGTKQTVSYCTPIDVQRGELRLLGARYMQSLKSQTARIRSFSCLMYMFEVPLESSYHVASMTKNKMKFSNVFGTCFLKQ